MNTDHLYQPRNGYSVNDRVIYNGTHHIIAMLSERGVHLRRVCSDGYGVLVMDIGYSEIEPTAVEPAVIEALYAFKTRAIGNDPARWAIYDQPDAGDGWMPLYLLDAEFNLVWPEPN